MSEVDSRTEEMTSVCCHFLLFWAELKHLCIIQSLEDIFEDVTTLERVPQHPMIQAVVGIVGLADLLRTSKL